MIRMIPSTSASHAKAYFAEALSKADYYLDDQELQGVLQGRLAERLQLAGPVDRSVFHSLCDNLDPATGKALTPRTKTNRITGYDISFSCPKSVSILHGLSADDHILTAFQIAVRATMRDIETDSKTRVRLGEAHEDRQTGELMWGEFIHQTARPLDGSPPDPQLHAHCFCFNATYDDVERRIKAARFTDIKRDMPYYQERFFKRLADGLQEAGYAVRRTAKSFEVAGIPEHVIDHFSKRTAYIEQLAKEQGVTDARELSELGARSRAKKQKGHTMAELKLDWRRQIAALGQREADEGKRLIRYASPDKRPELTPQHCVDHAIDHSFERASVQGERRLLARAYRHSLGQRSVSLDAVTDAFHANDRLVHVQEHDRTLCTTRAVLGEEQRMVRLAQQGQGKLKPLYAQVPPLNLDGQQRDAVAHLLTSPHRVSIIRGAAGTGKTTLMKEAINHIHQAGKAVTVVAPTAQASRGVLREEGFDEAQTVAQLLIDPKAQQRLANNVLWVDEAGLLGTRDMTALLELASRQQARLILGGDTRQHNAVVRGDALRILNTVAGIQTAEVSRIYRQRGADYRQAVEALANGQVGDGFTQLDAMDAIQSIDPLKPNQALVTDYVAAISRGKSALAVSPTHAQNELVTQDIRQALQAQGLLGKKAVEADRLTNLNLSEAERGDPRNFKPGLVVQFNQNTPGIKRGSAWTVTAVEDKRILIQNGQAEQRVLPTAKSSIYDVYQPGMINLAKGDQVRITRNGFDQQGKRLNNGQSLQVVKVNRQGELMLRNPQSKIDYLLPKQFGHLAHNYCVTSHAAQGKTVDEVFISQPASTFEATNAKQFYVSVSRGRDSVRIYTDDKEQLLLQASQLGDRQSALELVSRKSDSNQLIEQRIRLEAQRSPGDKEPTKAATIPQRVKQRDYEPGL